MRQQPQVPSRMMQKLTPEGSPSRKQPQMAGAQWPLPRRGRVPPGGLRLPERYLRLLWRHLRLLSLHLRLPLRQQRLLSR
jgi:hypothetical protein